MLTWWGPMALMRRTSMRRGVLLLRRALLIAGPICARHLDDTLQDTVALSLWLLDFATHHDFSPAAKCLPANLPEAILEYHTIVVVFRMRRHLNATLAQEGRYDGHYDRVD